MSRPPEKMYEDESLTMLVGRLLERSEAQGQDIQRILEKLDRLETHIGTVETRLSEKIGTVETSLNEKIGTVETSLNEKIGTVETSLNEKIETVQTRLNQLWYLGAAVVIVVTIIGSLIGFAFDVGDAVNTLQKAD